MRCDNLSVFISVFVMSLFCGFSFADYDEPAVEDFSVGVSTAQIMASADERYKKGDYDGAVQEYKKLLSHDDYNPAPHWRLATSYRRMGMYEDAARHYNLYLQKSRRNDRRVLWMLAYTHNLMGRHEEALEYLNVARQEVGYVRAPERMEDGLALWNLGKFHESIEAYDGVFSSLGGSKELRAEARRRLSYLYVMGGNYVQAKDEAARALKISTESAAPYMAFALAHFFEGDFKNALLRIEEAVARKREPVACRSLLYEIYKETNDPAAEKLLEELKEEISRGIAEKGRQDGRRHNFMAYVLIESKDLKGALPYVDKARGYFPGFYSDFMTGYYHYSAGDYKRARGYFEKSVGRNPFYHYNREYLSKIHRREGRFSAARKEVDAALKINPYNRFILAEAEKIKRRERGE